MKREEYKKGLLAMLGSMLIWGVLPAYWQALRPINSWVIILYRIVLVALYAFIAAFAKYGLKRIIDPLRDRKTRRKYIMAGAIITVNWSTYIYTVNIGQVVQSALGYYIEPLMICLVGIIFFKEQVTKYKATALILAFISVVIIIIHFGDVPKLALLIALTFTIYTAIKTSVEQPPVISILYETIWFAPFALVAVIYLEAKGMGALSVASTGQYIALYACGLVTLIPLGLFASGARRLPVFLIGLMQYISPTIALVVGLAFLGESVDMVQIICFCIIWVGLTFFSIGEYKEIKNMQDQPELETEETAQDQN